LFVPVLLMLQTNKLECLSFGILNSLVLYLTVMLVLLITNIRQDRNKYFSLFVRSISEKEKYI
jgi:hypothetical protein